MQLLKLRKIVGAQLLQQFNNRLLVLFGSRRRRSRQMSNGLSNSNVYKSFSTVLKLLNNYLKFNGSNVLAVSHRSICRLRLCTCVFLFDKSGSCMDIVYHVMFSEKLKDFIIRKERAARRDNLKPVRHCPGSPNMRLPASRSSCCRLLDVRCPSPLVWQILQSSSTTIGLVSGAEYSNGRRPADVSE